ncbi:MAG: GLUG motif-containing protein [Sedimentisphaerales bacterium]
MRSLCIGAAAVTILFCCSFLFAQEKVKYQEFAEVEIIPNAALSISDIEALPKAPGSSIETLDNGAVLVQIPVDEIQAMTDKGAQIKSVRNFLLVTPAGNTMLTSIGYEYGESDEDVDIPEDGSFAGSGIDFTASPAKIITSVDVHYEIESSWTGYVYAELSDYPETRTYSLVDGVNGSISQTKTGITAFNGMSLNRVWVLWAAEYYSSGGGFIDYWWIKIYYNSGSDYCYATTTYTAYEYISRVLVGSINNSTGSSGYADYTSLSTTMNIGTGYPITVNNGNPYSTDGCCIWVDWNHDKDFDDAGETISVSGTPGVGPYTATIIPPAGALTGNTRMRVRIVDTDYGAPLPCGTASYGEVEDYTINVSASQPTLKVSGHITLLGNGSPLAGVLLEVYNGSTPTGLTDISDSNGYYEIEVPSPWTGYVNAQKQGYVFSEHQTFTNVTTNQVQDFNAHYAYSGGIGTEGNPYLIATAEDMNSIGGHLEDWGRYFKVIADIDLSGFTGTEFKIIGSTANPFTGVFDGNSHIIRNVNISGSDNIGLFASISSGGKVQNLRIEGINVIGSNYVGGLAGASYGSITNCYVTGIVYGGGNYIGGLVGYNNRGNISNCCSMAAVSGSEEAQNVGGLVGYNDKGSISGCYSTGTVSGCWSGIGGLAGSNDSGSISNCYSTDAVISPSNSWIVGGLVGDNYSGSISNCYSTGAVSGTVTVGGLVGYNYGGSVAGSFWDVNTSGQTTSDGGEGKSTVEIQTLLTFTSAGWDFVGETANGYLDTWRMCVDGLNYPKLSWQFPLGDFVCPDGVDFIDYAVLAKQWKLDKLSFDIAPDGGDGIVNFLDFAVFADNWQGDRIQLSQFMSQWLKSSAYNADIAPAGGDGVVNMLDFAAFVENWLKTD